MYKYNKIFFPKEMFFSIDFDLIKQKIKKHYTEYDDFGSLLIVSADGTMISVNNLGKVEMFYNNSQQEKSIKTHISAIENIFKESIENFKIITH